ncbi:MAG TPA: class I SAM-dependent methyltransferase [Streptosporangiaceae bacterium]|jgi:SAM-dependent methyltransferase
MSFEVSADAYTKFMARFSEPLAVQFADLAGVGSGGESGDGPADGSRGSQRALDVGCGPGALSAELVRRLGSICAVDPSEPFVLAARDRLPEAEVRLAPAEQLPFDDGRFDVTMAQLVVQFLTDPVAGLREMARVTRPGGVVAACVWDRGGGRSPLSTFWSAVDELDPVDGESSGPGVCQGGLARLFAQAGLAVALDTELTVRVPQIGFDEWWEPFLLGVGPGGDYVLSLDEDRRAQLRERCQQLLAAGPPVVSATAWAVTGAVG